MVQIPRNRIVMELLCSQILHTQSRFCRAPAFVLPDLVRRLPNCRLPVMLRMTDDPVTECCSSSFLTKTLKYDDFFPLGRALGFSQRFGVKRR